MLEFRRDGKLVFREIIDIPLAVGVERDEGLEIIGRGEFRQQGVEFFFRVSEILGGRNHFPHHIFDVTIGRLLELLFALGVISPDFLGRDDDGAVRDIGHRGENEIHIRGDIAFRQQTALFEIRQVIALLDERSIFGKETFAIDILFKERPEGRILTRLIRIDGLNETDQGFPAESTGSRVIENALLQEDRGDVATLREVEHFFFTHGKSGISGLRDENFIFEDRLPGRIADLGLLLFRRRILAHHLGNLGVGVELLVVLFV